MPSQTAQTCIASISGAKRLIHYPATADLAAAPTRAAKRTETDQGPSKSPDLCLLPCAICTTRRSPPAHPGLRRRRLTHPAIECRRSRFGGRPQDHGCREPMTFEQYGPHFIPATFGLTGDILAFPASLPSQPESLQAFTSIHQKNKFTNISACSPRPFRAEEDAAQMTAPSSGFILGRSPSGCHSFPPASKEPPPPPSRKSLRNRRCSRSPT